MAIYQKDNRQVELKNEVDIQRYKALGFSEVNEKGEYLAKPVKDDKKNIAELEKIAKEKDAKIAKLEKENKEFSTALKAANVKIKELEKAAAEKSGAS